jgi:hypothetical protein
MHRLRKTIVNAIGRGGVRNIISVVSGLSSTCDGGDTVRPPSNGLRVKRPPPSSVVSNNDAIIIVLSTCNFGCLLKRSIFRSVHQIVVRNTGAWSAYWHFFVCPKQYRSGTVWTSRIRFASNWGFHNSDGQDFISCLYFLNYTPTRG